MSFDFIKVVGAISKAMAIVEKIRSAKGKEKAQAVADALPDMIETVEAGISRDVLNDAAVMSARDNLISAIKSFSNAVDAAKQAKGTGTPV